MSKLTDLLIERKRMKVKIKKLNTEATVPSYAKSGDAGLDLTAISKREVSSGGFYDDTQYYEYSTGLALEIPEGYVGLVFPRSSISNTDLTLANSVGVIDSGYRGEVKLRFKATKQHKSYGIGEKIAQLIILPYPMIELEEVENLSDSERGVGGFGSSDK